MAEPSSIELTGQGVEFYGGVLFEYCEVSPKSEPSDESGVRKRSRLGAIGMGLSGLEHRSDLAR